MAPRAREIVVCGGDYEHTSAIGGAYAGGLTLSYRPMRVQDIFISMLETRSFEACEFSLANYLTLRGTGQHWLTAVPVFPYRAFRHGLAITRRESALTSLTQLGGVRVGVEDYSMTAAVWFRAILKDEYGVNPHTITWVTRPKQRFDIPAGVQIEKTTRDLEELLLAKEIDALLGMSLKDSLLPAHERRLRTVLADAEAEERAYYKRTSIYPIMHCVVIRNDVLESVPGIVEAICEAYARSKGDAYRRQLGATLVPWGKSYWARTFELFEGDPLPYGFEASNRLVVERLASYLEQQGFVSSAPSLETVFATA